MRVIGFAGKSGAGKSTAAALLAGVLVGQGFSVKIDAFGLPIKQDWRNAHDLSLAWLEKDAPARAWMQGHGAAIRENNPQYWIRHLEVRNHAIRPAFTSASAASAALADFLVIDDVRHENEAAWCAERGVVWLVKGEYKPLSGAAAAHASETALTMLDAHISTVIDNTRDLAHLAKAVACMVKAGEHLKKGG